jgi:hypothetical protein
MRKRDLLSAAAGAVVATVLAGGVAWAAIPSAGGAINGCYQKNQGQLRVIDPGTDSCRPSEIAIAWNTQGIQGEKGDQGDPGAPGRDGVDGRDGTSVTVEPEAPGANCPAGGAKLTAANGVAYVCSALQGEPDPGPDYY